MSIHSLKRTRESALPISSYGNQENSNQKIVNVFNQLKFQIANNETDKKLVQTFIDLNPTNIQLTELKNSALEKGNLNIASTILIAQSRKTNLSQALSDLLTYALEKKMENPLPIAKLLLESNPSSDLLYEWLKNNLALKNFRAENLQITLLFLSQFLEKNPTTTSIELLLSDVEKINNNEIYLKLIKPLVIAFTKRKPGENSLILHLNKALNHKAPKEILEFFLDSLLEITSSPSIFKQLKTIFHDSNALKRINEACLKALFIKQSADPKLKEYDFSSLSELEPELFAKIVCWITRPAKGLIYSPQFSILTMRPLFISSILEIIKLAQESQEFRSILSYELDNALVTCIDRASLSVNNLLLQKSLFEAKGKSEKCIFELFKSQVAVNTLREYSIELSLNGRDPIELQLGLERNLQQELNLIGILSTQKFPSHLTQEEILSGKKKVLNVLNDPERLTHALLQKDTFGNESIWVSKLKKNPEFQTYLASKLALFYDLLETLDSVEWEQKVSNLDPTSLEILSQCLNEETLTGEGLYLTRANALKKTFILLEESLLREKTLEKIKSFEP